MAYSLPDLPYDYGALEPHTSGQIIELHHDKHHAAYVAGANTTLEKLADARDKGDFGIAHIRFKRGYVALDVRVIDARTGRVLSVATATGRNSRFGFDFDVFSFGAHHSVHLPGVLTYFSNTPVEKALQEMVILAVRHVAERVPAVPAAP